MKKLLLGIAILAILSLFFTPVLAQEAESPIWFKMFEPLGIIVGLVSLALAYLNYRKFGGVLGKSYSVVLASLVLFMLAFAIRSLIENKIIPNALYSEAAFEMLLYAGVLLIAVSSYIAHKGFQK